MSKTLFIHIPKAAGTSIVASCPVVSVSERYFHPNKLKEVEMDPRSYRTLPSYQSYVKHAPYNYLDREMLQRFDRVVAVVRNPWSRLVSMYHHADAIRFNVSETWYNQPKITFDEYLNRMDAFRMTASYYWNHPYDQWGIQLDWITQNNNVKVDILRYENLQQDLNSYFNQTINLEKRNIGKYDKDYKDYYNEEQIEKVANWFRLDIERWGFTFDSGATRNYWGS